MKILYSKHISWQVLDDSVYIIDEVTLKIYKLTDIAKDFWLALRGTDSFNRIEEILYECYDVSESELKKDLEEFLDNLFYEKLLMLGD